MPDHNEVEAGPSKIPIFKKKKSIAPRQKIEIGFKPSDALDNTADGEDKEATKDASINLQEFEGDDEDEKVVLDDLIAFRNSRLKPKGIDLDRLNKGELKKKKKKRKADEKADIVKTKEDRWAEQMRKGGLMSHDALHGERLSGDHAKKSKSTESSDDEENEEKSTVPKLLKENNFQGETGTVDVDKHMMAYIEEEMKKRRQGEKMDASVEAAILVHDSVNEKRQGSFKSAEDELYKIAEKYRAIQQSAKEAIAQAKSSVNSGALTNKYADAIRALAPSRDEEDQEEGNASISTSMLTGVPEVDLGMEVRMRNIEATEKAKRAMEEVKARQREEGGLMETDTDFASARCKCSDSMPETSALTFSPSLLVFRHHTKVRSDAERIAQENADDNERQVMPEYGKRPVASDDAVVDRFKKRQRNQLKR